MLTPTQIEEMRDVLEASLPDEIELTLQTRTKLPGGSWSEEFVTESSVPARVGTPGGGETDVERAQTARLADEITHVIWIRGGDTPALDEVDRIIWNDVEFEILLIAGRGEWEISRRVYVKEL